MNCFNDVSEVRSAVPRAELYAGLAEEAAELAHAALKCRRAIDGTNPTPVSEEAALAAVYEEVADVMLYLGTLGLIDGVDFINEVETTCMDDKLARWKDRLKRRGEDG